MLKMPTIKGTRKRLASQFEPRKPRDNAVYSIVLGTAGADHQLVKTIDTAAAPSPSVGTTSTTPGGFDSKAEQGEAVADYDVKEDMWSNVEYKPDGVVGPEPRSMTVLVPIKTGSGRELLVAMVWRRITKRIWVMSELVECFQTFWAFDVSNEKWFLTELNDQEPAPGSRDRFDTDIWVSDEAKGDRVIVHGELHNSNQQLNDAWMFQIFRAGYVNQLQYVNQQQSASLAYSLRCVNPASLLGRNEAEY
ncbi:uncharacterized protein Z518_08294 [Rhinocladiella mackenziei CBS 650.93]|uniref:Uncharacterized protein n=1 Tax=Rhinocladiella mackenziei CBS 650.93 TaxID=1442369 RepID=A0A0D2GVQ4_9EURO|nr:uncharacterized protein Z518_08294 [Rhinocladiella mackenziei CBS 650.93]KIX02353.1 hypothetical protein Z518_08294 [Rhinocladiella mackenziei CBS 650.93]